MVRRLCTLLCAYFAVGLPPSVKLELVIDGASVLLSTPLPPLDSAVATDSSLAAAYGASVVEAASLLCSGSAACVAHGCLAAAMRGLQQSPDSRVAVETLVAQQIAARQNDVELAQRASLCYTALAESYEQRARLQPQALARRELAAQHWRTARTLGALAAAQLLAGTLDAAGVSAAAAAEASGASNAERAAALNTLGSARLQQRDEAGAIAAFASASALRPDAAQPVYNLAFVEAGGARRAVASLVQLSASGNLLAATALVSALPRAYFSAAEATEWVERADAALEQLERAAHRLGPRGFERAVPLPVGVPPHWTHAFSGARIDQIASILTRWSALWAPRLAFDAMAEEPAAAPTAVPESEPRVRVGFASSWFCNSAIGRVMAGVMARLDPTRFKTFVYLLPSAGGVIRRDFATEDIMRAAAQTQILAGGTVSSRAAIAADRLDILVFTDIGMETASYFLAFSRMAPVQIVFWGHPLTSGIPDSVDYYLLPGGSYRDGDMESASGRYTEQLVRLDTMATHYVKVPWDPSKRAELYAAAAESVPELRLLADDDGPRAGLHLYAVSQHCRKFHPRFDAALVRILSADPGARLIVRRCAPAADAGPTFVERLANHSGAAFAERVVAVPALALNQYLAVLATAQVMLEPFPFRGSITTLDAFTVGTPVVTNGGDLDGRATPKLTVALYRRVGMHGECCVAHDEVGFSELAVRLASDSAFRARASALILAGHDLLFEDGAAVDEWERFLLRAHGLSSAAPSPPRAALVPSDAEGAPRVLERIARALHCGVAGNSAAPELTGDVTPDEATSALCTAIAKAAALAAEGSTDGHTLALALQDGAALLCKHAGLGDDLPAAGDEQGWKRRRNGSAFAVTLAELAVAIDQRLAHASYSAAIAATALLQWDRAASHYRRLAELKGPFDARVGSAGAGVGASSAAAAPPLPVHPEGRYNWKGVADHGPLGADVAFRGVMYGGFNTFLLDHTSAQLHHLVESGVLDAETSLFARRAAEEYETMSVQQRGAIAAAGGACEISAPDAVQHPAIDASTFPRVAAMHGRAVHIRHTPALRSGALALTPAVARDVEREFKMNNELAVVDDVLTTTALSNMISFCQDSTIFWRSYIQGYQGAFLNSGFGASGLVLQIAHELQETFPAVLRGLQLRQAWAYKYSGGHPRGIDPHSDDATVSVNCWVTPDEANLSPSTGGLVVYAVAPPKDMTFANANYGTAAVQELLGGATVHELEDNGAGMPVVHSVQAKRRAALSSSSGGDRGDGVALPPDEAAKSAASVRIAHRQNRCLLFSGRRFHQSDAMQFKRGYRNRRINLTFLFS